MKYILLLCLLITTVACNNKTTQSEEPILACPLLHEFEKLQVEFTFNGTIPSSLTLFVHGEEIRSCTVGYGEEICITAQETTPMKLTYLMRSHHDIQENISIELKDGLTTIMARTNESIARARTRPNDPCGSGFISKISISE